MAPIPITVLHAPATENESRLWSEADKNVEHISKEAFHFSSLEEADEEAFLNLYPKIVEKVVSHSDHEDMEQINRWLSRVMHTNVPNGKRLRGLSTLSAYRKWMNQAQLSPEQQEEACILGWCVEMLHAAQKMNTNIIGEVEECRGAVAWHLHSGSGPSAFNDAVLLIGAMFYILKETFEDHAAYANILNTFHEAQLFRAFGQGLEQRTDLRAELNHLNLSRHEALVKYQGSYFSFYFPIAVAYNLAGRADRMALQEVKEICLRMGYLYQVKEDRAFMRTDIESGTPSWYLFTALKRGTRAQKRLIKEAYGPNSGKEDSSRVLGIYQELELEKHYSNFVVEEMAEIMDNIEDLTQAHPQLPLTLLTDLYEWSTAGI